MKNVFRLLAGARILMLFMLLEAVAFLLITSSSYYQQSVVMNQLYAARSFWHKQWNSATQYVGLKEVNEALNEENTALHNMLAQYQSTPNALPGTAFGTAGKPLFSYIPATIIDNSVTKQHNYIVLNVGSANGVAPDMGVIADNGIVGVVTSVTEHCAFVKSLLHTNWRCNVRLMRTGDFGPMEWDGITHNESVLYDIPEHSSVQISDTVVTSGFSGIFPPNIPVGVVIDSHQAKRSNFHEVRIRLFIDFKKIQHVRVVSFLYRDELQTLKPLFDEY
ncbi:MAG: rod shape-determining protein MreC [Prevotellaceae bacterium]|jgi:rod shape-determining protein MreC|nr:rod shape-determining protein MreC [Prevotellaceae bacterium]